MLPDAKSQVHLPNGQKWKAEWLLPECQPLVPENQGMTRYGHAGGAVAIELSYFAKVSSDYVTTTGRDIRAVLT